MNKNIFLLAVILNMYLVAGDSNSHKTEPITDFEIKGKLFKSGKTEPDIKFLQRVLSHCATNVGNSLCNQVNKLLCIARNVGLKQGQALYESTTKILNTKNLNQLKKIQSLEKTITDLQKKQTDLHAQQATIIEDQQKLINDKDALIAKQINKINSLSNPIPPAPAAEKESSIGRGGPAVKIIKKMGMAIVYFFFTASALFGVYSGVNHVRLLIS
jgi:hypothetical protein